jgi:branched-chain amino acid transport system substrate-binding protein
MYRNRIITSFVLVSILIFSGILGCSQEPETNVPPQEASATIQSLLKVGAIFPFTGGLAFVGESCRHGVELALKNHKKRFPDAKIDVIYEDSANDPKTGIAAYRKLRDIENTQANFSIMSSVSGALLAQDPNQILLVSIVSHSNITEGRPHAFRYFLSSDKETSTMANYLADKGVKKAAFLYVNDDFGLDALDCFQRYFSNRGGVIVLSESFEKSGSNVDGVVTKTIGANPEAVYFVGYGTPVAMIAKRLHEQGYKGIRCSFSSFFVPPVLAQAGEAAEDILFSSTGYDPSAPQTEAQRSFIQMYEETYGKKPDYYAPFSYDIASIFFNCWSRANGDMPKALSLMAQLKNYQGVIGTADSNEKRDFQFPTMVKVVRDGKAVTP